MLSSSGGTTSLDRRSTTPHVSQFFHNFVTQFLKNKTKHIAVSRIQISIMVTSTRIARRAYDRPNNISLPFRVLFLLYHVRPCWICWSNCTRVAAFGRKVSIVITQPCIHFLGKLKIHSKPANLKIVLLFYYRVSFLRSLRSLRIDNNSRFLGLQKWVSPLKKWASQFLTTAKNWTSPFSIS